MRHLQEDYGSYYQRNLCTVKSVAGLLLSYTLLSQGLSSHDEAYSKACILLGWYHTYDFFDKIQLDAEKVLQQINCISGTNEEFRIALAPNRTIAQEVQKLARLKTKEVRMPPGFKQLQNSKSLLSPSVIDVWLLLLYDEVKDKGMSLLVLLNSYFASLFAEEGRLCESFTIEVTGEQFRNEMRSIEQITPDSQLFSKWLERDLIGTLNGLDLSGFNFSGVNLVEWDLSSAPVIKSPEERDAALKSMEPEERAATEVSMSPDVSPKVRLTALAHMSPEAKEVGLAGMMPEDLAAALASLSPEDMAATLASMSPGIMAKALASMSPKERADALLIMSPEEREEAVKSMSPGSMAAALGSMKPKEARSILGRGYRGAILEDCMFIDCEITKCNLQGAVLSGSRFGRFGRFGEEGVWIGIRNCNFSATTFGDYEGPTTYFQEVEISHTSFKQARLQNTRFTNSLLTNVHFNAASFRDVVFTNPIGPAPTRRTGLYDCDFTGAFLETTLVFHNVKLTNCFFNKATGNKARGFNLVFESCELQNVHFDDAELDAVEFRGSCELKSVFFTNATLGHLYFNYSHASTWCSVFDPSLDLSGAKIFSCRKGSEDASIVAGDIFGFLKRVGCKLRAPPIEEMSAPPASVEQSNPYKPAYPSLRLGLGTYAPRRRPNYKSRTRQHARSKKYCSQKMTGSKPRDVSLNRTKTPYYKGYLAPRRRRSTKSRRNRKSLRKSQRKLATRKKARRSNRLQSRRRATPNRPSKKRRSRKATRTVKKSTRRRIRSKRTRSRAGKEVHPASGEEGANPDES